MPFQQFAYANAPAVVYVGLRADEPEREGASYGQAGGEVYRAVDGITQRFPLREWGWGIKEVLGYLEDRGVEIPPRTDCDICFFQRLPEWYVLWRDHPNLWLEGEAMEEEFGHTFRSPSRDSWPAAMKDMRVRFEAGEQPRGVASMDERGHMCRACRI